MSFLSPSPPPPPRLPHAPACCLQVLSVVAATSNLDVRAKEHALLCATSAREKKASALLALPGAQVCPAHQALAPPSQTRTPSLGPFTLHPTPYTLHPTPYTLRSTSHPPGWSTLAARTRGVVV
jgi:hypothetical protein